jgi:hypothetical protein
MPDPNIENMEFLEDHRPDDLNKFALSLYTNPPYFNFTGYQEYSIAAYRYTIQILADLENSDGTLNYGLQNVPAITMWYMSVNSFINVLLKSACIKAQHDYLHAFSLNLKDRYLLLLTLLTIQPEEAAKNMLAGKLDDFERFFKSIGYDVFEEDKNTYAFANFSGLPNFTNQTDVLQACLISYEVFEAFRFVFYGLDLMPYISLMAGDKLVFDKMPVLMQKVLIPSVKDILCKHKLKTKLRLSQKFAQYPVSTRFTQKQVLAISKYQSAIKYKHDVNPAKTKVINSFHELLIKKYKGKEDQYKMNFLTKDF